MTAAVAASKKPRSRWRKVRNVALVVLALLMVAAGVCVYMVYSTPGWYVPMAATDAYTADYAQSAQNKLVDLLRNKPQVAHRYDQSWTITEKELNGLLASRFVSAGGGAGSGAGVSGPMVHFTRDTMTFAARTTMAPSRDAAGGVVSLNVEARTVRPDEATFAATGNHILFAIKGVRVGNMPVPDAMARPRIEAMLPQLAAALDTAMAQAVGTDRAASQKAQVGVWLDALRTGRAQPITLTHEGRTFQLKDFTVTDGALTLTIGPPGGPALPPASATGK